MIIKSNEWVSYNNGNYTVNINLKNGTKIRETKDNIFIPSFPECIDLKITNQCDMKCVMCHEDSYIDGKHGDLNAEFINTIKPFTEIAIGGGNALSHPDLITFLYKLKNNNIIANITINQNHFIKNQDMINKLVNEDLIKGLGISLTQATDNFVNTIKKYPNAVIHVINGIITKEDLYKLYDNNLKLLILGYKKIRRGKDLYNRIGLSIDILKQLMYENLPEIIKHFKIVSFDNLAIEQLDVKRLMSEENWNEFYMGDDGQFTMYIDLVEKEFAVSSTSIKRYIILDNIVDMFNVVRKVS
jgi:MoaA/NifB/PqqE/SkfB family radical SAM enzyme